ncbi:MAG: hypothetical protein EA359_10190 [Balneolaceae bacterium]|nr:MAG: hypothetical protein EA359_10190 [Balneolaceae bacterium]
MMGNKLYHYIMIGLALISGCRAEVSTDLPDHIDGLENFTVYSNNIEPVHDIIMTRQVVYSENENVMWGRVIMDVAVDSNGSVYISDMVNGTIHVDDGDYLIFFGSEEFGGPKNEGQTIETSRFSALKDKYIRHDIHSFRADGTAIFGNGITISDGAYMPRAHIGYTSDNIVYAWGEEMLFKVYDSDGDYMYLFYYPYQNIRVKSDHISKHYVNLNDEMSLFLEKQAPETWPAFNDLIVDDSNRLWVSAIIDDFEVYQWWVLKVDTGELLARFEWHRDKPILVVRNGHMYTRERDEETGLQQIVRYRIGMEK